MAGLQVLRLINGPTAAAIAYGMSIGYKLKKINVLVLNLESVGLDFSIINLKKGVYKEIALTFDNGFTAEAFENIFTDFLA